MYNYIIDRGRRILLIYCGTTSKRLHELMCHIEQSLSDDCSFKTRPKYNLIVSWANFFYLENRLVRLRLFSDICHVMTKID